MNYVMTWNPAKWTFTDYQHVIDEIKRDGFAFRQWSCFSSKAIPGDKFVLKQVGKNGGIIAEGVIASVPYLAQDWADARKLRQYVKLQIINLHEPVPVDDWKTFGFIPQASGCKF